MHSHSLLIARLDLAANKLCRFARQTELRIAGAQIGRSVQTYGEFFEGFPQALVLHDGVRLLRGARLVAGGPRGSLIVGKNAFMNRNALIDSRYSIRIGEGVAFGPNCYVTDYDHSQEMNQDGNRIDAGHFAPVMIAEHVWVGANVSILKGVSIGARAIIGAGSVVTRDVPADVLAAGVPARVIRNLAPRSPCRTQSPSRLAEASEDSDGG